MLELLCVRSIREVSRFCLTKTEVICLESWKSFWVFLELDTFHSEKDTESQRKREPRDGEKQKRRGEIQSNKSFHQGPLQVTFLQYLSFCNFSSESFDPSSVAKMLFIVDIKTSLIPSWLLPSTSVHWLLPSCPVCLHSLMVSTGQPSLSHCTGAGPLDGCWQITYHVWDTWSPAGNGYQSVGNKGHRWWHLNKEKKRNTVSVQTDIGVKNREGGVLRDKWDYTDQMRQIWKDDK